MNVNLFIIGAAKSGTTSLCEYLTQHSQIFTPNLKEPHFFSNIKSTISTTVVENEAKYFQLYKGRDEKYLIDGSTSYLFFSDLTAKRIKNYNKEAKIIIMLRNPVDRAYSHYLMAKDMVGDETYNFKDVLGQDYHGANGYHGSKVNPYIDPSFYFKNVAEYFKCFSKENIHIVIFEDMINNLQIEMNKIFEFLNIDRIHVDKEIYNRYQRFRIPWLNKILFNEYINFIKSKSSRKLKHSLKKIFYKKSSKPILDRVLYQKLQLMFDLDIDKLYKLTQNESVRKWKK